MSDDKYRKELKICGNSSKFQDRENIDISHTLLIKLRGNISRTQPG